jgi:uncharacterized membrane protein YedE/YeeE
MKRTRQQNAGALTAGLWFGAGLAVSGMTQPRKVIGFLDVFGAWDASLVFVMAGAIAVHFIAYRLVGRRRSPLLADHWALPTRRDIDLKLLVGAAVFGVGWGLAGYCPGPGLVSAASGSALALVFVVALLIGLRVTASAELAWRTRRSNATHTQSSHLEPHRLQ